MANKHEVLNAINNQKNEGQDNIRRMYLKELEAYTHNDTIIYFSSFPLKRPGIPSSAVSIGLDDIPGYMTCINGLKNDKLDLILHSPGGSLEAAEQVVQYLRLKYKYIRAIIPQNAMSAATMIACACDEIIMGKESAIGPIDPQMAVPGPNNSIQSIPAHAILEDFKRAKEEVAANSALAPIWIPKIMAIPPGYLNLCEQTIELSKEKVEKWLNDYMFNGKQQKGREIAEFLGNFTIHKTHGRPINIEIARSIGLNVIPLECDPILQDKVLSVYHASLITFDVTPCVKIIENHLGKGSYTVMQMIMNQLPIS